MNKVQFWVLWNALIIVVMYLGLNLGVEGAKNIIMFYAWMSFVLSLFADQDASLAKLRQYGRVVPAIFNVTVDVVIVAWFIWFGFWMTGIAYLVHLFLVEAAWELSTEGEET